MKHLIGLVLALFLAKPVLAVEVGGQAPEGSLKKTTGEVVTFRSLVAKGPSVVIFYRGGWCPYCNFHLKDLRTIEADLKKKGVQILAISPDRPAELKKSAEKIKAGHQLYSDQDMKLAEAFKISFVVDKKTRKAYKGYGIDLEKSSGRSHFKLPIPSVFLLDKSGKVLFRHSNPDYKVRLAADKILQLSEKHFK